MIVGEKQTIGNRFIRELVEQETQKRIAAYYAEESMRMAQKDAEIADLKRRLKIAEARSAKNYSQLARIADGRYTVRQQSALRRVLEGLLGGIVMIVASCRG